MKALNQRAVELLNMGKTYLRRGWCQETLAMDMNGKPCQPEDPLACEWCAEGALTAALHARGRTDDDLLAWSVAFNALEEDSDCGSIANRNDDSSMTKSDVLSWYDKAAARLAEAA